MPHTMFGRSGTRAYLYNVCHPRQHHSIPCLLHLNGRNYLSDSSRDDCLAHPRASRKLLCHLISYVTAPWAPRKLPLLLRPLLSASRLCGRLSTAIVARSPRDRLLHHLEHLRHGRLSARELEDGLLLLPVVLLHQRIRTSGE